MYSFDLFIRSKRSNIVSASSSGCTEWCQMVPLCISVCIDRVRFTSGGHECEQFQERESGEHEFEQSQVCESQNMTFACPGHQWLIVCVCG